MVRSIVVLAGGMAALTAIMVSLTAPLTAAWSSAEVTEISPVEL